MPILTQDVFAAAPNTPINLVTAPGYGEVLLYWDVPLNNGGSPITDYKIYYLPEPFLTSWVTFNDGISSDTSATVTGLVGGVKYQFVVSAINVDGASGWSNAPKQSTFNPESPPPDPPNKIYAVPGYGEVLLYWDVPLNNGGSPITDYKIQFSSHEINSNEWVIFDDGISSDIRATVTGLVGGVKYQFVVSAINGGGSGVFSPHVFSTPTIVPNTSDPTNSITAGNDNAHKTKPTFGLDHNTGKQLIEGGFSFNGVSHDITDNFWTPFAEQEVLVGDTNTFTIKTFTDKQLKVKEFLFGIPEIGEAHNAELGVEIFFGYDGTIDDIKVIQKTDVIDAESANVISFDSKCRSDSLDEKCITTQLTLKFLEPLKDKIMAFKATDFKNRYTITYLNDGFDVTGESLNLMPVTMIPGTEKYEGLLKVTQIAKYSDIWAAEDGRIFKSNEYGTFQWINEFHERTVDSGEIKNRLHSDFVDYKDDITASAITQLLEICPTCLESYTDFDDSFTYDYSETHSKMDDSELKQKMILEEKRANKMLPKYLN